MMINYVVITCNNTTIKKLLIHTPLISIIIKYCADLCTPELGVAV